MQERVLFRKDKQREFLNLVIFRLGCASLRGLLQFGFNISYSSLKNYYSERRLMSRDLFEDLCYLIKMDSESIKVKYLNSNFGQIKGGRKSKKKKKDLKEGNNLIN